MGGSIVDSYGDAVLIEAAASKNAIRMAGNEQVDKYLFSTNHYNIAYMKNLGYPRVKHSINRYKAIESYIASLLPKITKLGLKNILSTTMPEGICCHHYKDGMGTLWSMIFDPIQRKVDICFGSPNVNQWQTFGLNNPAGIVSYSSTLPNESTDIDFWKPILSTEELTE